MAIKRQTNPFKTRGGDRPTSRKEVHSVSDDSVRLRSERGNDTSRRKVDTEMAPKGEVPRGSGREGDGRCAGR